MKYIIQAKGLRVDNLAYYVVQIDGAYRWKHGRPGFENAVRFNTAQEAAQAIADHRLFGAGGAQSEVVAVKR